MKYESVLIKNPLWENENEPEYHYVIKKQGKVILKINIFSKDSDFDDLKETNPMADTFIDDILKSIIFNVKNEIAKQKAQNDDNLI